MTSDDRGRRLEALLALALETPLERRREVLAGAERDPTLVDEVCALLAEDDADFMVGPAVERLVESPAEPLAAGAPLPEVPGYTLVRRLGAGGMGEVFLATDDGPARRMVAIKRIRSAGDAAALLARFAFEREAMARLNHPSVAQLYGTGKAPDGWPFAVMEHVEGLPITTYCDERRLRLDDRLRLFLAVCRGVEHAHRRQLLHRDLKPSNILVTESDGEPVPKIIDFGIARALDAATGDAAGLTGTSVLGTPAYMSPEALAHGHGPRDLDTRTDVYSLGVVLYQLLVGTRPFEDETTSDPVVLLTRLLRDEPPRPSVRWRELGEDARAAAARRRRLDPDQVPAALEGDLDWIVMKAIEKERDRRYGSVAELAADVERHLRLEPVEAGPPSWRYRTGRYVRRNRWLVGTATVALLALVAAVVATSMGLVRTRAALRREAVARTEAEEMARFLQRIFFTSAVNRQESDRPHSEVTARELLDEGAKRVAEELAGQPARSALMRYTIGDTYSNLGLFDEAVELLELALDDLDATDAEPAVPNLRARAEYELGSIAREQSRLDDALAHLERADELVPGMAEPERTRFQAGVWDQIAIVHMRRGDHETAERFSRRAIALLESAPEVDEDALLSIMGNLGTNLGEQGRLAEAEEAQAKALALARKVLPPGHIRTARVLDNLAVAIAMQGRLDEAAPLFVEALEARRGILAETHPDLAISLNNLAQLHLDRGHPEDAEPYHREALEIRRQVFGDQDPTTAWSYEGLSDVAAALGRTDEAREWMRKALDARRDPLGDEHPAVAHTHSRLGALARGAGDLEEAEARYREALAIRRAQGRSPYPKLAEAAVDLAEVLAEGGELGEVPALLAEAEGHLPEPGADSAGLRGRVDALRQGA